ncbi:MAG TPA: hypothetical protein VGG18_05990 [Granulicella sp.]
MTDDRRVRPRLATVICIYEAASVLLGVVSYCILIYSHRIHPSIADYYTPLLQTVVIWLRYVLALAGAVALWQMRRAAFYLLAGRVVIALVLFLVSLLPATPLISMQHEYLMSTTEVGGMIHIVSATFLIFHACIAWYVYHITSPQSPHPRVSTSNPLP